MGAERKGSAPVAGCDGGGGYNCGMKEGRVKTRDLRAPAGLTSSSRRFQARLHDLLFVQPKIEFCTTNALKRMEIMK